MEYAITALSDDEMEWIADSVNVFAQNLSDFIEAGLDDDVYIEFRNIEVNVTAMNGVDTAELTKYEHIQRVAVIKQYGHSLNMTSYTNCSVFYCSYIIGADTGVLTFNESEFEHFVTIKLREYFNAMVHGMNVDSGSAVECTVKMISEEASTFEVVEVATPSETEREYAYYVLVVITAMISMVGIAALAYEKGVIPKVQRKVDTSRWTAFLALGLQFGDFASDISLCFELWSIPDLLDPDKRLVFVSAVGSAVFLVVPYVSNLRIAASIKNFVNQNQAASTWFVTLFFTFSVHSDF